jgi:hypothetical protein
MTFSNVSYLREVLTGVEPGDSKVVHVCLIAPLSIVERRIKARAQAQGVEPSPWELRRAAECCVAHQSPEFALHVQVGSLKPAEVAAEVIALASALPDPLRGGTTGREEPPSTRLRLKCGTTMQTMHCHRVVGSNVS